MIAAGSAGARIAAIAWPNQDVLANLPDDTAVPRYKLGDATTGLDGSYAITYDMAHIPAEFVGKDGQVDVQLIITDALHQTQWSYSVVPGTDASGSTVDDALPSAVLEVGGCGVLMASTWQRNRPEHFLNVYAYGGAPGSVTEHTDINHTMGVAVMASSSDTTWSQDGTMTKSFSNSASQTYTNHSVWNRVNYRDFYYSCSSQIERRPVDYYDLLSADGGTVTHKYFPYCTSKSAGGSWSTSNAKNVTCSSGVDVGPINVSAQSGYTKGLTVTFNFSKATKLCGTNPNGPYASSQVETHAA